MHWFRLPLFVWSLYSTSLILVLATPVLAITLALVALERFAGVGVFDPQLGGDPLLFQHLFWFYSHPAVYIMILPGFGVVSEIIPCFARKRIFGYKFIAFASMAIAVLGFLVWGHHMFVSSQSVYAGVVFSFLSFLVAVPSAIKVFNWTATLYKGHITLSTPMLYALGFIGLFTIGGLTGLVSRHAGGGCPCARHLFRRRPFPLHHGRRNGHGLHGRHPLLVAQDDRPPVSRRAGQALGAHHFRGLQPDVLPAVHPGLPRHAAPLSMPIREQFQVLNVLSTAGATILALGYLLPLCYLLVVLPRPEIRPQSVAGDRSRMDQARLAAHRTQLRVATRRGLRSLYV